MSVYGVKSYGAFLADKRAEIIKHLEEFAPTVVIPSRGGIYVFADSIAKVHSTIVLAGVGRAFEALANWYRNQITNLVLSWSARDPEASVEVNMLPPVFYPNLSVSNDVVLADLVVVEIGSSLARDYVARVDAFGKISKFDRQGCVVISYKNRKENGDYGGNSDASPADEASRQEDIRRHREEVEAEYRRKLKDEFADMKIRLPDGFDHAAETAEFLKELRGAYPGRICFLRRHNVKTRKYNWVFEMIK